MKDPIKLGIVLLIAVFAVGLVMKFVGFLVNVATPLAIVAGVGLLLYGVFGKKSLGGGRSRLP